MLGLKLNHVSKRGQWRLSAIVDCGLELLFCCRLCYYAYLNNRYDVFLYWSCDIHNSLIALEFDTRLEAQLPRCLLNFKAIQKIELPVSWLARCPPMLMIKHNQRQISDGHVEIGGCLHMPMPDLCDAILNTCKMPSRLSYPTFGCNKKSTTF